jgi:hypothetical protein
MRRPRFRLSTLLWLTLAVACWFGGMRFERWRTKQDGFYSTKRVDRFGPGKVVIVSERE